MAGNGDDEESAGMEVEGMDITGASGLGQQDEAAMDGAHMEEVSIFSTTVVSPGTQRGDSGHLPPSDRGHT